MFKKLSFYCFAMCIFNTMGQYEDKRCRCICPTPEAVFNHTASIERSLIKDSIPPSKCNCYGLIVPRLGDAIKGREEEFCQQCECKFEQRNTTVMMIVVIMVLWVVLLLSGYMGFLFCLDPLIHGKRTRREQPINDANDEEAVTLLTMGDCNNED